MEKRFCPSCNSALGDHDGYFCSTCGKELPGNLVRTTKTVRIRTYSASEPVVEKGVAYVQFISQLKNKTFWLVFGLVSFILFVLIGIANTGFIELASASLLKSLGVEEVVFKFPATKKVSPTVNLSLSLPNAEFDQFNLISHVPAEVDFYFEGTNLAGLLNLPPFSEEDSNFTPKARVLLHENFAGFAYDVDDVNRWGFLFVPKDSQIAQSVFGSGWGEYWKIAFINDYMLIANNEDVFDLVKSVDGGLTLSLAQNPNYVTKAKNLSSTGQFKIFMMTKDALGVVRNSLGGLNQQTIGMINKILTSGLESLVITNQNVQN